VSPLAAEADVQLRVFNPTAGRVDPDAIRAGAARHPVWVLADKLRMRQVLVNLLSNAVKYNRIGGTVTVSWQGDDERGSVRIEDSGLGMTTEKLERLFEPFNRLGAENSKIEGTGIVLVLSRRLVELMQGELRIESEAGRGTEVSLTLVSSHDAPRPARSPLPPSQHGPLDEALRVLYAEDNEVNVEIVRQLTKLRPSVIFDVAQNGATALDKAFLDQPQLMLVDMNLGDMTGIDLARALRADPATANIRLVALSADALPEQIDAALAMGFEDYITKPIDFRQLLNVLDGRPANTGVRGTKVVQ